MKIVLILPSLQAGGLEKVITKLAWYFNRKSVVQIHLIVLSKGELFYALPENMEAIMPPFSIDNNLRPIFLLKLFCWLRRNVKEQGPDILLSFGGKYNAFVTLSVVGLPVRVFVSDRSRPSISYGWFLDWLNSQVYKRASGIIAQTEKAKALMLKRTGHENISVIGNPIHVNGTQSRIREKVILNVGRFVRTKQQEVLVKYFAQINAEGWSLWFVGGGHLMDKVKKAASDLGVEDRVLFWGEVSHIEEYYQRSDIFAFTSISEGFPNALGEAMAAGMACISFDCEAGPSDLIVDGENGFLIPENDHERYISKLKLLINNESIRKKLGKKAKLKASEFSFEKIGHQYFNFFQRAMDESIN